jgi:hypothetical protein
MSLDVNQLEKVRRLGGNLIQARCPACAEEGGDKAGEHLRIQADGRFGCCVHPKDGEHRRRIFALVGDRSPRAFTIRVAHMQPRESRAMSIRSSLSGRGGTVGTAVTRSEEQVAVTGAESGTLRTLSSLSRAYAREDHIYVHTCKDLNGVVPRVPVGPDWKRRHRTAPIDENGRPLPYVRLSGTLVIPFDSDERFHYWKGGQSLALTRQEAISRKEDHGTGV